MNQNVQVCWVTGNSSQRNNLINIVKSSIYKKDPEYELLEFDSECSIEYVVSKINTFSCLGNTRLIILNDWPESKTSNTASVNTITKVLLDLPSDCTIILNNLETESKKFNETIKKVAKEYHYNQFFEFGEATNWIIDEFKKIDKTISNEDATKLTKSITIERNYKTIINIDKLLLLFKKLNHYTGTRKKITSEDVFFVAIDFSEFIIWNLYNYLDQKDLDNSMLLSNKLLEDDEKTLSVIEMTLNSMIWRYKLLLCLKEGASLNEQQLIVEIKKMVKLTKEGNGNKTIMKIDGEKEKNIYSDGIIKSLLKGFYGAKPAILCYTKEELYYILKSVNDVLLKIRSGASEKEARKYFEIMLAVICNVINPIELEESLKEYRFKHLIRS